MEKEKITFSGIVEGFAPGWFAAVMGTGVLSMTSFQLAKQWQWLSPFALTLHWFNILLFLVLSVPWLLRWVQYRSSAVATFNHPVQSSFYSTYSIALLILSAQCWMFGLPPLLAELLWWFGALLTILFSLAILYRIFNNEAFLPEHITPAHYIPAVGLVVIPLSGMALLPQIQGFRHELALFLNIFGLGTGMMLYGGLLGLSFFRHYLHKPAFGILTPTIWVQIAPLGIIPVSLMNLLSYFALPGALDAAKAMGILFWGAGLWWAVMAAMMTLLALKKKMLPFALSWWAFIFPLGALTSLSLRLNHELGLSLFYDVGLLVWGLMLMLWSIALINTVRGVISGALFQKHP